MNLFLKDKTCLDYATLDIDEFIIKLKEELNRIKMQVVTHQIQPKPVDVYLTVKNEERTEIKETTKTENKKAICDWSKQEVDLWFKNKKITSSIVENLSPCDGNLLDQLHLTLNQVPEFFHSILRSDSKASLKDIVIFTGELRALFKKI